MGTWRNHVHIQAQPSVEPEPLLQELAVGLADLFTLTWASPSHDRTKYLRALLRPNARAQATLMTEREVACVVAPYTDIEVRALNALIELIDSKSERVDNRIAILVHSDPNGNEKLRAWGDERGLALIPLYRSHQAGMPEADQLVRSLAGYLYRHDPFALTEPVAADRDFFGRRGDAENLLRSLANGKVRSLFAIRRAGKTSIVNRMTTAATSSGDASLVMIDASDDAIHSLDANQIQKLVAASAAAARRSGYAVAGEVARAGIRKTESLLTELTRPSDTPLLIVFDEVDFIGPASIANPRWALQFVPFWRAFRVAYQEARRQNRPVGVLVCGVSSRPFREVRVGKDENPVFGFVPEEYLEPFAFTPAERMIRDLGLRCGLRFEREAVELMHRMCRGFPYWMRLAGSFVHRSIDVDKRPTMITIDTIEPLMREFMDGEGTDHVEMALTNLTDRDPEVMAACRQIADGEMPDDKVGRLCVRYGLVDATRGGFTVTDSLMRSALGRASYSGSGGHAPTIGFQPIVPTDSVVAELAVLHDRLERDMRTLVRGVLQANRTDRPWLDLLLQSLPARRRNELQGRRAADLLQQLYFIELRQVIVKRWGFFEKQFGDQNRFKAAMDIANDRPFAHPKDYDAADLALFRREYRWLQDKVDA